MKQEEAMKYNRRIFPFYKGFGWDPLFYSAIIFLFLTEVKGIAPAKVMYAEAIYSLFLLILQIPASILIERIGSRKALILGTIFATIQITMMIFINNFAFLILAYFMSAFGNAIKDIARNTLLYASTQKCKGKNSFGNINAKGSSFSYVFSAISSIFTGYLFVVNPYIPLVLSSLISMLAVILACRFEEIDEEKKENRTILESIKDIKQGFKFIIKSERLKALFLFTAIFVGVLSMITTYEKSLLTDLQIAPQYFGIIFAILQLSAAITARNSEKIHKTFRNKTLTYLTLPVTLSCMVVGFVGTDRLSKSSLLVIVFMFLIQYAIKGPYRALMSRYINNFTNRNIRPKLTALNYLLSNLLTAGISLSCSWLLSITTTANTFMIIGCVTTIIAVLLLDYMRGKVGLKPEQYSKEDLKYSTYKPKKKA